MSILNKLRLFLEAGTVQKFSIPPKIKPNVKISGNLGNAANWKAKIVLGNSMGADKKVGDWDTVRYVAIDLKSNIIVPIAISDEHQNGSELIWHYKNKNLIPNGHYQYIDSWGNNYIYRNHHADMVEAFKKFKMYGGNGNLKVKSMGNGYNGTIDDYIKRDGDIIIGKNEIAVQGKKIIFSFENIAKQYKMLDTKKPGMPPRESDIIDLFASVKYLIKQFLDDINDELHVNYEPKLKSLLNDDIVKKMLERIEVAEPSLDYVAAAQEIFSMNGLKNRLHQAIKKMNADKETGAYSPKSYFISIFGNLDNAIKEFDRVGQI